MFFLLGKLFTTQAARSTHRAFHFMGPLARQVRARRLLAVWRFLCEERPERMFSRCLILERVLRGCCQKDLPCATSASTSTPRWMHRQAAWEVSPTGFRGKPALM